jgi:hypothetical protein
MSARAWLLGLCLLGTLAHAGEPSLSRSLVPVEHQRTPDQTFLTFPEWYLVYSPAEYATFVKDRNPSDFPFFGHVGQFWQSYRAVHNATKDDYPFNFGYHVMIMVIGVSTTVEYALRSAYETTIGRVAELTRRGGATEEDKFGALIAQDYVDFIRIEPWYKYDFLDKVKRLWRETTFWGPNLIRKWERKYALTTEYLIKAVYGWLIKLGAQSSYDEPLPVTAATLNQWPASLTSTLPNLKLLRQHADGSALVTLPRYQAFTAYSLQLAQHGVRFAKIAGNASQILISVLLPAGQLPDIPPAKTLFTQPILTEPARQRVAWVVPVASLSAVLVELAQRGFEVEHVYDY